MRFRKFLFYLSVTVVSATGVALFPHLVLAAPGISLSPKSGAPGTEVTVSGTNFISYAGDTLVVYFAGSEAASSSIIVPASGNFLSVFQVPDDARPGVVTINVGQHNGAILAGDSFVVPAPEIRLDTSGGTVGTVVTAMCRGFTAGKPITFSYFFSDDGDTLGTDMASDTGECTFKFTVPASPRGNHVVLAGNPDYIAAIAEFETISKIEIQPTNATIGDIVTVVGTGFLVGEEVTLNILGQTVAYGTTQERGSFTAQCYVPALRVGTYLVTVQADGDSRWVYLTVVSRATLSKTGGGLGDRVTLTGIGFEPRSLIEIKYDYRDLTFVISDATGGFTCTFAIPRGTSGPHFITATDGQNTEQVTYTVESDPPAAPVLLTPRAGTEVTSPLALQWEAVYDISPPLTYTLQIARTKDFVHPILEKSDLPLSQYTLTDTERLLPNRDGEYYYWRVRAIDGASNVGKWSETMTFRIKPPGAVPPWGKYVLVLAALAIIISYMIVLHQGLAETRKQSR